MYGVHYRRYVSIASRKRIYVRYEELMSHCLSSGKAKTAFETSNSIGKFPSGGRYFSVASISLRVYNSRHLR